MADEPARDEAPRERLDEVASRLSTSRVLLREACAAHDPGTANHQGIPVEVRGRERRAIPRTCTGGREQRDRAIIDAFGRQRLTLVEGAAMASMSMTFAVSKLQLGFLADVIDAFSWSQPDHDGLDDSPMLRVTRDIQHVREGRRQTEASMRAATERAIAAGESLVAIQDTAGALLIAGASSFPCSRA